MNFNQSAQTAGCTGHLVSRNLGLAGIIICSCPQIKFKLVCAICLTAAYTDERHVVGTYEQDWHCAIGALSLIFTILSLDAELHR